MERYLFFSLCFFTLWGTNPELYSITTTLPVTISSAGSNGPPQVAVAGNGNAIALWTTFPNQILVSSFKASSLTWSTPLTLATGSVPRIAIDGTGNAIAVWVNLTNEIAASRYDVSTSTWSTAVIVSTTTSGAVNTLPQISMNSSGVALVVWILSTPYQVLASSFNPSTLSFSPPTTFLSNTNPASFDLDNVNTGIAVWQSFPTGVIQASQISVP